MCVLSLGLRQLAAGILASQMAKASTPIHIPAMYLPSTHLSLKGRDVVMDVPENKFSFILTLA